MTIKARYVPIVTGLFWVAVSIGIMVAWRDAAGVLYWVRGAAFAIPALFGLHSLKVGMFASDERVNRLTQGERD